MLCRLVLGLCLYGLLASSSSARPPVHTLIYTSVTSVAGGSALHVAVDRPELSSLTTTGAVRMYNAGGNLWIGRVAVFGSASSGVVTSKFLTRTTSSGTHCTAGNGSLGGASFVTNLTVWDPGYTGKTVFYHTTWTNAFILYRLGTSATFVDAPMTRIGAGRSAGEYKYQVTGIGEAGKPLEFVPHGFIGGSEQYDNPSSGGVNNNYYTPLDAFFLQDKNIFNYAPPSTVSAPQVITWNNWASSYTGNGIPSRGGRIYLPRGYTQNTSKKYPVLYMHDGQNVFDPGGAFGSWSADAAATREISHGRMRETIIVAVNNSNSRMSEYGTPQDGYTGDYYLKFLVNNVRPAINSTYRTLTNFMDTGNMGSSLGGLISAYIGLSTNVFGLIGAVSPSYWYGPNFRSWISTQPTKGNRIYQDAGTTEGTSMWDYFWPVYQYYLEDGYVVNDDLKIAIGCSEGHNEAAWANRVAGAFRFLYNPWDEVNSLETNVAPTPGTLQFVDAATNVVETAGSVRIYVSRTDGSSGAVSATYFTSNGTALAGTDYVATNGTLNWTNNETATKFFDVFITDDAAYTGVRDFSARLTGSAVGSPSIETITITDNEPPPPQIAITNPPADIVVSETTTTFVVQGEAQAANWSGLAWSNSLTGASGLAAIANAWSIPGIGLGVGTNEITVSATNLSATVVTNAADRGADSIYSNGWIAADNGGFGFGGWQLYTSSTNVNMNGRFMAVDAAVNIGTPAWGLYANSGNLSEAKRFLTNALAVGQSVRVSLDNGFIDAGSGVGVALQNATGQTLWEFYFNGGDQVYNISGSTTDVGWTSSGIDVEFTLSGPTAYTTKITPLGGTTRTNTGNLNAMPNTTITLFRAWNYNAGAGSDYDVFFNNLQLLSPGPGTSISTSDSVRITRSGVAYHDGIPLAWWNRYGLGTNSAAALDHDTDFASNWEEYVADTDPTNSASVYSNRIVTASGLGTLTIQAGPPTTNSRIYDVWHGTNLLEGIWNPLNLNVPGANDGSALMITVTNHSDAGQYRTSVRVP